MSSKARALFAHLDPLAQQRGRVEDPLATPRKHTRRLLLANTDCWVEFTRILKEGSLS